MPVGECKIVGGRALQRPDDAIAAGALRELQLIGLRAQAEKKRSMCSDASGPVGSV
jgi:hypothetical protein